MNTLLIREIIFSIIGGTSSTMIYLFTGHLLDQYISHNLSTILSYLTGMIIGYIIKVYGFSHAIKNIYNIIPKYIFSEMFILTMTYFCVRYLLHLKPRLSQYLPVSLKPYYNTIVRLFVAMILFIFLSFPLQKYWIFT